jgi:hypothetical protein
MHVEDHKDLMSSRWNSNLQSLLKYDPFYSSRL